MASANVREDRIITVTDFLLYYGFLGVKYDDEPAKYIFDLGYDMRILKVLNSKYADRVNYILNPAFYPGLNL